MSNAALGSFDKLAKLGEISSNSFYLILKLVLKRLNRAYRSPNRRSWHKVLLQILLIFQQSLVLKTSLKNGKILKLSFDLPAKSIILKPNERILFLLKLVEPNKIREHSILP